MTNDELDVLIIVGSPRERGKSAKLADAIREALGDYGIVPTYYPLATYPVAACTNCGGCHRTGECIITGDGWHVLSRHMDSADLVFVVAPVFFAGPAGHLKAMLDRCQTYWARKYLIGDNIPKRKPAHLMVVGDGGDPFGPGPLETICTSALNCANVRISPERTHRFIGEDYDLSRVPSIVEQALRDAHDWIADPEGLV